MKLALKYTKKVSIVLLFAAFIFVAKKTRDYVFAVDGYSCNFDNIISSAHKSEIFNFINLDAEIKTCSLKKASEKIKDKFCAIKNLELCCNTNGILSVNISGYEPKFLLNWDYVLAENKTVLPKSLFAKKSLENCKCFVLQNLDSQDFDIKKEITESCKNMIFSLPEKYFQDYEIIRESSTKSYMQDKNSKNFAILFNDFALPDDKLLAYCLYIKNELCSRGEFKKKEPKNWFADIRFKDQIVVINQVRGR